MNNPLYGIGHASPFGAYPGSDFDLESGSFRRNRRKKASANSIFRMLRNMLACFYKFRSVAALAISLSLGFIILVLIICKSRFQIVSSLKSSDGDLGTASYPFAELRNLVMVAGHSVYTSSSCGKVDREDSWFLQPYQRNPGQAATFVSHIKEGVEVAARDVEALLLFSGGETRKDAGPRSEAQSYWAVAESKGWFGKENVRTRALTEEHARDSFENLLFSVCRFRELTGSYPKNITVVSYDFKEERFAQLHRSAIGFPEDRFFYSGTPVSPSSKEAAVKGEAAVRAQFAADPYGCFGSLHNKKLKRDPFHRTIPYPGGCPEMRKLFNYCGPVPFTGVLPWV